MALTSYLGTEDSRLGNIILGKWQAKAVPTRIGTIINLKAQYQRSLPVKRKRPPR